MTDINSTTVNNNNNNNYQIDIANALNKMNNTMSHIKQQQDDLNKRFNLFDMNLIYHINDIDQIKICINDILCPLLTTTYEL